MSSSLDFLSLGAAYASGAATPASVARDVVDRIAGRGDDGVWISRVPPAQLLENAAALERRAAREGQDALPLYGLPFAVKDNIDVVGMTTTAGCPSFAHAANRTALAIERLLRAGALLVGKTNLDQFATGLTGMRSPYGTPRNPFDADCIPGGSSSGSAVAVASGLVSFAIGTDTAGSGRVPAGFANIVGLKPTRGLVSTRGVVPACRSLDCVSVFALTVEDAAAVFETMRGVDPEDAYSRAPPPGFGAIGAMPARFVLGVPQRHQLEFFGNEEAARLYEAAIARLESLGGIVRRIDFAPFREAATLLYDGPWLVERRAAIDEAIGGRRDILHPVIRRIIADSDAIPAAAVFRGRDRLAELAQAAAATWRDVDVLVLPTAGTTFRLGEVETDPVGTNAALGHYTNFTNLLDLAALAVPNGFQANGLPAGVTLLAPAFHDPLLAAIGAAFHARTGLRLGATGAPLPVGPDDAPRVAFPYLRVAVFGAHLSGQPLNGELRALGARLRHAGRTAPEYRLYALPDGKRPGLVRCPSNGTAIECEVWGVPVGSVGALLASIAPPLGLGSVALDDGSEATGFLCEAYAVAGAHDITESGGWRAWIAQRG